MVGETTNRDKILQKFKQQWPAFEETAHEIISSILGFAYSTPDSAKSFTGYIAESQHKYFL